MPHPNRGRYVINLDGPWRNYTRFCEPGWVMLGTIQCGMKIGALARDPEGLYVQVNSQTMTPLNQRKVAATLSALSPK